MTKDLNEFIRRRGRRRYVADEAEPDATGPRPIPVDPAKPRTISRAFVSDGESLSSRIRQIATENDPNLLRRERRKRAANDKVTDPKGQA